MVEFLGFEGIMLAVADALHLVLARCRPPAPVVTSLAGPVLGFVLGEDVASDLDMPPFDKALMDGYAGRAAELIGETVMPVAAEVMAGQMPPPLPPRQIIRIMTGAPIPDGADTVVPIEQTSLADDGRVRFASAAKTGQNILRRAAEMSRGEVVLKSGTVLTPPVLGLLASVGRTAARLYSPPSVAVLATGDELVEANRLPGPGQLRNSNGPMLVAQAQSAGAVVRSLGIAPDEFATLRAMIREAMNSAVVILSGGVSVGQRDLVPSVLSELGVEAHIHRIAMKPGKPFYFGTCGDVLVFGLPGNPVSSFCCFELFVRPALRQLAGHADPGPNWREATLIDEFAHRSDRPTYHPARLTIRAGVNEVQPVAWLGSPDLRALTGANALVLLAAGVRTFSAGERLPVMPLS